jgi:hypothetical protein
MENFHFKRGDMDVEFISTEKEDGQYTVEVRATGDKAQVEAFMKDFLAGTTHLDLPIELYVGKEDGPNRPLKVSELMGGN